MLRLSMKWPVVIFRLATLACTLMFLTADGSAQRAIAASPFRALAGHWDGSGTLTLQGGTKERVRCRADYGLFRQDAQLLQELRCASDSYKFELKGDVVHNNGEISGHWEETTHNVSGSVVGHVKGSQINARIEGLAFAALVTLTTHGNRQIVAIRSPGAQVEEVLITLHRRGH